MRTDATGVAGWVKNSFIDFPGTVSTVLFFSGCNLRCPYCHNPELIGNDDQPEIPLREIQEFLQKRKGRISGVVLSGGEPTMHHSAQNIATIVRSMGYSVKLDTNGMLPEKIEAIAPDYLALDVKTIPANYAKMLKARYVDVKEKLAKSIVIVKAMNENAEIRITIAPDIVNKKIIEELALMLSGIKKVYLQPMKTTTPLLNPSMSKMPPVAKEEIEKYRAIVSQFVERCEIRGV
jgi:pyruvate formate lyase activating enzyme